MKVLITGGAGFLGINLIRHLLENGVKDIASIDIADFDTSTLRYNSGANPEHLPKDSTGLSIPSTSLGMVRGMASSSNHNPERPSTSLGTSPEPVEGRSRRIDYPERERVVIFKGDIRDRALMECAMKGVDIVVHTAAALPLYKRSEIYSVDVGGTRSVLEAAYIQKVDRFIHISTTAVYGIPKRHPIYETDDLGGAEIGDYGRAKVTAEDVCLEYRKKGMCLCILRPKSFIGPERLGIFAILYDWAKDGKNFPIVGSGNNRYQLLDVADLCRGIYLCMTKDRNVVNDTFNIGAKEFTTIREDFQSVLDHAGHNKRIVSFPVRPALLVLSVLRGLGLSPVYKWNYGTVYVDSFVSTEKAEKALGFVPEYSNKDALIRNFEWYLANMHKFGSRTGVSHRIPWKQGALKILKLFF